MPPFHPFRLPALMASLWVAGSVSGQILRTVGFTDLQSRYGASLADGSGVSLFLTEAREGEPITGPYFPNPAGFPGRTVIDYGGPGVEFSGHAAAVLGHALSMTPGLTTVGVMSAAGWVGGGGLNLASSDVIYLPLPPGGAPTFAVVNAS
jgi:hypothetical protein